MPREPAYEVRFNYRRLQKDVEKLGFKALVIQQQMQRYWGVEMATCSIYAWYQRGCIPLTRLAQLLSIVRLETGKKLDVWRYIDIPLTKKVG